MSTQLANHTVGSLVAERPSRSRVFERLGIDYCCGGKQRLKDACAEKSIALSAVVRELQDEAKAETTERIDWTTARLSDLIDNIIAAHHDYLREALPRLSFLTEKVRNAHAQRHPELVELAALFATFRTELEQHMEKEEQVLFPFIKRLETEKTRPAFQCGSVNNPIEVMEKEHEDAGAALARMRALTGDYVPPSNACNTYRAMLDALAELESDMHQHVHKENSILFPRASALEATFAAK